MSSTPSAPRASWTSAVHHKFSYLSGADWAAHCASLVKQGRDAQAETKKTAAERAGKAGSPTGRVLDEVKLGALRGARFAMTGGLALAAGVGGLTSPLVRRSLLLGCGVPLGLVGTGTTHGAPKPEDGRNVWRRMLGGVAAYGACGAVLGAFCCLGRAEGPSQGALAQVVDALTAAGTFLLHVANFYLCLYPHGLLLVSMAAACVVGGVVGALYGLTRGGGHAEPSAPAATAHAARAPRRKDGGPSSDAPAATPRGTDAPSAAAAGAASAPSRPDLVPPGATQAPAGDTSAERAEASPPAKPSFEAGSADSAHTEPKVQLAPPLDDGGSERPLVHSPEALMVTRTLSDAGSGDSTASLERKRKFGGANYVADAATDAGKLSPVASAPTSGAVSARSSTSDATVTTVGEVPTMLL